MRVFISSTSEDLEAYRAAARDVVLHLGGQVVMMEYLGTDGSAGVVDACAKKVRQADVVLAILGWRGDGRRASSSTAFRVVLPAAPRN